jgi:hypothetical protein
MCCGMGQSCDRSNNTCCNTAGPCLTDNDCCSVCCSGTCCRGLSDVCLGGTQCCKDTQVCGDRCGCPFNEHCSNQQCVPNS